MKDLSIFLPKKQYEKTAYLRHYAGTPLFSASKRAILRNFPYTLIFYKNSLI